MDDQEQVHARHLAELERVEAVANEMGYPTELIARSGEIAYHTLLVGLEPDARGRPKQMALNFYPVGQDEIEHSLLLQYFIDLPIEVDQEGLERVRALLPDINNKVILGHMGISAGTQRLHYRYVQTLRVDQAVTAQAVADVITMVGYTPMIFEDLLQELAHGTLSLEQARTQVMASY